MKRLSLEELKAKAGKNVVLNVESINGGEDRIPPPKTKPLYPCTERA